MKKIIVLSINTPTAVIEDYFEQGYSIEFTMCDESNSCYCQDCVKYSLPSHLPVE